MFFRNVNELCQVQYNIAAKLQFIDVIYLIAFWAKVTVICFFQKHLSSSRIIQISLRSGIPHCEFFTCDYLASKEQTWVVLTACAQNKYLLASFQRWKESHLPPSPVGFLFVLLGFLHPCDLQSKPYGWGVSPYFVVFALHDSPHVHLLVDVCVLH